jgi:hypothetical protein
MPNGVLDPGLSITVASSTPMMSTATMTMLATPGPFHLCGILEVTKSEVISQAVRLIKIPTKTVPAAILKKQPAGLNAFFFM